jgi:hypothetical protein
MVARDDRKALRKDALPNAPTLLEFFLEALAKRKGRDPRLQGPISPSADQGPNPEPFPAVGTPAGRRAFSK